MSKEISLEEIRKFWPGDAPNIQSVPKYIAKYKKYDNELPGAIRAQLYIGRTNR